MVDLVERLHACLRQESSSYMTVNYLEPAYQKALYAAFQCPPALDRSNSSVSSGSSSSSSTITEYWREKIAEWCYQVVDHFDFSREVVSVAIHYLDRYLATKYVNKKIFQLAAMTSLYLAVKLHEPGRLSMAAMIELSRGVFVKEQMKAMEMELLRALTWKVHPPTAYCFCKHMLFLMPYDSISMDARHDVLEMARFLTELSVIDYYFVSHKASVVALAALLYSMQKISSVSDEAMRLYDAVLQDKVSVLCNYKQDVAECCERFRQLYTQGGYEHPETVASDGIRNEAISPVCVSYGFAEEQYVAYGDTAAPSSNNTHASQKVKSGMTGDSSIEGPLDVTVAGGSVLGPSSLG